MLVFGTRSDAQQLALLSRMNVADGLTHWRRARHWCPTANLTPALRQTAIIVSAATKSDANGFSQ